MQTVKVDVKVAKKLREPELPFYDPLPKENNTHQVVSIWAAQAGARHFCMGESRRRQDKGLGMYY